MKERSKCAYAGKGSSWNRRHTGDTHNGVGEHLTKEYISKATMSKVDKRINPPGSDGCLLKCYSCGSFRHLLDKCPDSWENLGKKSSGDDRSKPPTVNWVLHGLSCKSQRFSTRRSRIITRDARICCSYLKDQNYLTLYENITHGKLEMYVTFIYSWGWGFQSYG